MPFFEQKNTGILGIDLGSSTIKLVELKPENKHATLTTYGVAEMAGGAGAAHENLDSFIQALSLVVQQSKSTATNVIAALPSLNVFTTTLQLPAMPEREIGTAVEWEAKKLLPLPIEKMKLDWHLLQKKNDAAPDANEALQVILTAAPREIINVYLEIFKRTNLNLVGLETEAAALGRSLLPPVGNHLIMDIGATTTNLIIYSDAMPLIVRHTDIGGETFNHNIANALNVTVERAEQFKNSMGLPLKTETAHPASRAIKFVIDNLVIQETRRLIDAFQQMNIGSLHKIILTGGTANMKNLPAYLQTSLQIQTELGNPWRLLTYPKELTEDIQNLSPHMAVAVGLALKRATK